MAKVTPKDIKTYFSAKALAISAVNTFDMAKKDILGGDRHAITYQWCLFIIPRRVTPPDSADDAGIDKWQIEVWFLQQNTQTDSKELEDHWADLQNSADEFIDSIFVDTQTKYNRVSEIVTEYQEDKSQDRCAVVTIKFTMSALCT